MGGGSGIAMSSGVGHRRDSDLACLWLWRRPATVALIRPLAWEPPHTGCSPKKIKRQKKKKKERKRKQESEMEKKLALLNIMSREGQEDIRGGEILGEGTASVSVQGACEPGVSTEHGGQCSFSRVIQEDRNSRQKVSLIS